MTLNVVFNLGPSFQQFLDKLGALYMPAFDDLAAKISAVDAAIKAAKDEVSAVVASEAAQVSAAIADLEAKLQNVLTPAEFTAIGEQIDALKGAANLDALKAAVSAIYTPPATPEA